MGALPKHKPSSRRQGRRRATHTAKLAPSVVCKKCGQPKLPNLSCPNCQVQKKTPQVG